MGKFVEMSPGGSVNWPNHQCGLVQMFMVAQFSSQDTSRTSRNTQKGDDHSVVIFQIDTKSSGTCKKMFVSGRVMWKTSSTNHYHLHLTKKLAHRILFRDLVDGRNRETKPVANNPTIYMQRPPEKFSEGVLGKFLGSKYLLEVFGCLGIGLISTDFLLAGLLPSTA